MKPGHAKPQPARAEGKPQQVRGSKTICIPCERSLYPDLVGDPARYRAYLGEQLAAHPELFPDAMPQGWLWHDVLPPSKKLGVQLRRIRITATGEVFGVCPSFVMPYMTGCVADVEKPLFLHRFGVPFRALTHVFGRNDMYWQRMVNAQGRNSLVGTTVKDADKLPKDLVADEKHTRRGGEKVYAAVTAGEDCVLGAELCDKADAPSLTAGYGVFAAEARNVDPGYQPETVVTDGWAATMRAWKTLFINIVVIRCFLHAFLSIRDRCKRHRPLFADSGVKM